jgi:outer membrane lipoprotein SlyB
MPEISARKDISMFAKKWLVSLMVPAALATSLGACNQTSGATQPGLVNTSATGGYSGDSGRVISIHEVSLRGGSGVSDGTLVGGGVGAAGGAAIGAATTHSVAGALVGGLLGAVGGAIAGTAIDRGGSGQRGIEVTVQKDDGQTVTVAQPDNGDVQMGDRVRIVQDRNGVAQAVRDSGYRRDL